GSAALTATGPVLNVLPLGVRIDAAEKLPELAKRAPLPGRAATSDIYRMKFNAPEGAFRHLAAQLPDVQRTDLALALVALWLGRLCSRMEYAAGFIFMRRMGSAALTATGPVLNVLPLGVRIDAAEKLPELAKR
ncbi:hypothetical protein C3730_25320, partial [Salmonella enterica]